MSGFTRKKARQRAKNLQRQAEAVAQRFVDAQDALLRLNLGTVNGAAQVDLDEFHADVMQALGHAVPKKKTRAPEARDPVPPHFMPVLLAGDHVVGTWNEHADFEAVDGTLSVRSFQASEHFLANRDQLPQFFGHDLHLCLLEKPNGVIRELPNSMKEEMVSTLWRVRQDRSGGGNYFRDRLAHLIQMCVHALDDLRLYLPSPKRSYRSWPGLTPPYRPPAHLNIPGGGGVAQLPTPGSSINEKALKFGVDLSRKDTLDAIANVLRSGTLGVEDMMEFAQQAGFGPPTTKETPNERPLPHWLFDPLEAREKE